MCKVLETSGPRIPFPGWQSQSAKVHPKYPSQPFIPTTLLNLSFTWVCRPFFRTEAGPPESPWQASTPELHSSDSNKKRKTCFYLVWNRRDELGVSSGSPSTSSCTPRWRSGRSGNEAKVTFSHLGLAKTSLLFGHSVDRPVVLAVTCRWRLVIIMSLVFSTPPNPPPFPLPPLSNICDLLSHLPRHPVINPLWSTTARHQLPTSNVQRAHHRPQPLNRVDSPSPNHSIGWTHLAPTPYGCLFSNQAVFAPCLGGQRTF